MTNPPRTQAKSARINAELQLRDTNLWSAIERYSALSYGPGLRPAQRVSALGEDPLFAQALEQAVARDDSVVSSEDPRETYALSRSDPRSSAEYFYKIRSNLSHRGKGAWSEAERLRVALKELLAILDHVLRESVFASHAEDGSAQ